MSRMIALMLFTLCPVGMAVAGSHWRCITEDGAQPRKQQVVDGLLPRVVFTGETKPVDIASRMATHQTPALSVAVIRAGRIDWSAAWGRLERDGKTAADCDTLFQAGSIAKPVTLLAALRMQQRGKLDFDADVATYLTSYTLPAGAQNDAHPVTLRHLFAHTAGLTPGGYMGYAQAQPVPTDVQTVRGEAPANGAKVEVVQEPGKSLAYSGGGYTVAEIVLQDAFDQPFERLMRRWLTKPAGMKQADFTQPLPSASHAFTARGHQADGSEVAGGWHQHPEQAAAGLWATASDLARLLVELHAGYHGRSKVFDRDAVRALFAEPFEGHSYGFRLIGEGEQVFVTHYGGTVGYRAGMTLNLRTGDGAVYLANGDGGAALGVEFLGAVSRTYGWPVFGAVEVKRAVQPVEVLKSLVGDYAFADGPTIPVVYEHEGLTLVFPNGDRYALVPIEGEPLAFIHADTAVRASFSGEGEALSLHLYGDIGKRQASGK